MSPGSPDQDENLGTSALTVMVSHTGQVEVDDSNKLDVLSEHEPTLELTDLPHSSKEISPVTTM